MFGCSMEKGKRKGKRKGRKTKKRNRKYFLLTCLEKGKKEKKKM